MGVAGSNDPFHGLFKVRVALGNPLLKAVAKREPPEATPRFQTRPLANSLFAAQRVSRVYSWQPLSGCATLPVACSLIAAKMCALRMKALTTGSLDLATNAMAETVVAYMTAVNLGVDGIKKRGKAKKHYQCVVSGLFAYSICLLQPIITVDLHSLGHLFRYHWHW